MGRDDMKVRYDDDYYQGEIEMGRETYGYEFKRAGANILGGSIALATIALNMSWDFI